MRMGPRWTLDLAMADESREPWNITKLEMRNRAMRKTINDKCVLLADTPPCIDWRKLVGAHLHQMDPADVETRHAEITVKMY